MPTITRKKSPVDPTITPVTIPPIQRENICECARLDHRARSGKAFIARVESALTRHQTKIRRLPERSLPAHTIAGLKPIAQQAADLARLLNPENLPIEVSATLDAVDVMTGAVHRQLLDIAAAAQQAIKELEGMSGRGALDRQLKEARQAAGEELEDLYHRYAVEECDGNDRAEFLVTCEALLKGGRS